MVDWKIGEGCFIAKINGTICKIYPCGKAFSARVGRRVLGMSQSPASAMKRAEKMANKKKEE